MNELFQSRFGCQIIRHAWFENSNQKSLSKNKTDDKFKKSSRVFVNSLIRYTILNIHKTVYFDMILHCLDNIFLWIFDFLPPKRRPLYKRLSVGEHISKTQSCTAVLQNLLYRSLILAGIFLPWMLCDSTIKQPFLPWILLFYQNTFVKR